MIDAGILADRNVELLNGEIIVMAPEGTPHTFGSINLFKRFSRVLGDRAEVRDAHPIVLSNSEPEPDIAVVRGSFEDYAHRQPTAEDVLLIVEVANATLKKDLTQKRATYASEGIQEYWVLDLQNSQLIVLREPSHGNYQSETCLTEGTLSPLAFPDISFKVSQLIP